MAASSGDLVWWYTSRVSATRARRSPATDRISENHSARNSRTANTSRNVARGGTAPFRVGMTDSFIMTQPSNKSQQVVWKRSPLVLHWSLIGSCWALELICAVHRHIQVL